MRCLKCNSANVAIVPEGAYGYAYCQDCGYNWDASNPMEAIRRLTPKHQEQARKEREGYERRVEETRLASQRMYEAETAVRVAWSEYASGRFWAWRFGLIGFGLLIGVVVAFRIEENGEYLGVGIGAGIFFILLSTIARKPWRVPSLKERFLDAKRKLEDLRKKQK